MITEKNFSSATSGKRVFSVTRVRALTRRLFSASVRSSSEPAAADIPKTLAPTAYSKMVGFRCAYRYEEQ